MEIDPIESYRLRTGLGEINSAVNLTAMPKDESSSKGDSSRQNDEPPEVYSVQMDDAVEEARSDSESESDKDITKKPPKVSERRKAQDNVFSSWSVMSILSRLSEAALTT